MQNRKKFESENQVAKSDIWPLQIVTSSPHSADELHAVFRKHSASGVRLIGTYPDTESNCYVAEIHTKPGLYRGFSDLLDNAVLPLIVCGLGNTDRLAIDQIIPVE